MSLPKGLYDLLVTEGIASRLGSEAADLQPLAAEATAYLAEALARQLGDALDDLPDGQRQQHELALVNGLLVALRERLAGLGADARGAAEVIDLIAAPPRRLVALGGDTAGRPAPELGLSAPWLFTAGRGTPSLLQELRRELDSADHVDVLISFITVSGLRKLEGELSRLSALDAQGQTRTRLRVLTTTYMANTEAEALERLARLPGCEVRVSLDGRRTRLHAKAWIFRRATGFGSAYVGSANLTGAALTGGLEWTVKIAQRSQTALFEHAVAHFETLWADPEFQHFDAGSEAHRTKLREALQQERPDGASAALVTFFDLQPKSYQQEMLDQLASERAHGRWRNLVVAATGTGKTVLAALDYRRLHREQGGYPRLLFVAHRREILEQAQRTYREVLRDRTFGTLLAGGEEPASHDHLFATIDGVHARGLVAQLGAAHWNVVVVDECHRLAADRFEAFITAVEPKVLLGLTATPERTDGRPILQHFNARPDGRPAVELRLWHALDLQLLAPFEYFACDDQTDFRDVPWHMPGEVAALDVLVSDNHVRAKLVIDEWRRLAANPRACKALVFCVTVRHARFMAATLNAAGLPARCVFGDTPRDERDDAPKLLMAGKLCALVTVDLYNEGIDLPMVDTLLLLRPTQSPVLFQQQIGRGLRLAPPKKESCLVLDFVGQHRTDYRFDRLLSTLTGLSRRELVEQCEQGFGRLPPGCHIELQPKTRQQVLASLRTLTVNSWPRLTAELLAYMALRGTVQAPPLREFLDHQALELEDVYRASTGKQLSGWTTLRRSAGLIVAEPGPEEQYFSRRLASLLHVDDPRRLSMLAKAARGEATAAPVDPQQVVLAQMLAYQVDAGRERLGDPIAFFGRLGAHPAIRDELNELWPLLEARSDLVSTAMPGLEATPLCLHAAYGVREVLTAVGWLTAQQRLPFDGGVLSQLDQRRELFFVTLDKSEGFHERVSYKDFAISPEQFHWQTPNSTAPHTKRGRRYLESPANGWTFQLFVRARKGDAYRACGPLTLESAEGERPMSIVWRLAVPLPARLFREFSVLRGA
ncbi:MAG: DUF3427 domain-containing protein [Rubrivivax sp.]